MAEKVTYELKANVTAATVSLAGGQSFTVGEGGRESYSTSDWQEKADLDAHPGLKRAESATKKTDKGGEA